MIAGMARQPDSDRVLQWISTAVLGAAAIGSVAIVFIAVLGWGPLGDDWPEVIPLLLFAISPYIALAAKVWCLARSRLQQWLTMVVSSLLAAWGLYCLIDTFFVQPSVLSGLVMGAVAGTQWFVVLALWGVAVAEVVIRRLVAGPGRG